MPRPFFIVGCPRSGTTLLRLCLDSHPALSIGPETGILTQLEEGLAWPGIQNFGFGREYWTRRCADFFASFQEEYCTSRGKTRWGDKTPKYVLILPFINELFPDCQVIHIVRDVYDVVLSHKDRWGMKSALAAIKKWSAHITLG